MCEVVVGGGSERAADVAAAASRTQRCLRFIPDSRGIGDYADAQAVLVRLTESPDAKPYNADRNEGVRISTHQSGGISRYARIEENTYLLLCGLLGLAQWRALRGNPLLRPEDFLHPEGAACLFDNRDPAAFPLLLEQPAICSGCVDFYHALGADSEILALRDVLHYATLSQAQ